MPDIENLMQEWQPQFEETLKEVRVHEILHSVSPKINDCYSIYIQIAWSLEEPKSDSVIPQV